MKTALIASAIYVGAKCQTIDGIMLIAAIAAILIASSTSTPTSSPHAHTNES